MAIQNQVKPALASLTLLSCNCSNQLEAPIIWHRKSSDHEMARGSLTETNFGRQLASSEKNVRDKALKRVQKWLSTLPCDGISEGEMLKLWKGLYMTMWMADKPLVQEELAVNLASLVDCLSDNDEVFLFITIFFKTMRREWSGIDRLRIDKFYMLIRGMLRRTLQYLQQHDWDDGIINLYLKLIPEALNTSQTFTADGITFHIVDVFLPELKKVADDHLSSEKIIVMVRPFSHLLATTPDHSLRDAITTSIFEPLAIAMETSVTQKLLINPVDLSTEFLNLAKDPKWPRSSANRKSLYQLRHRFASLTVSVCGGQQLEQDVTDDGGPLKSKIQKSRKRDSSLQESVRKGKKKKKSDDKDSETLNMESGALFSVDTSSTSSGGVDVMLNCRHGDSSIDVVADSDGGKKAKKLRKRRLSAMATANSVLLPDQDNSDDYGRSRHKLLSSTSRLECSECPLMKKKQKKRHSLPAAGSSSESVLLLQDSGPHKLIVKNENSDKSHSVSHDQLETTSSPVTKVSPITTRSGKRLGVLSSKQSQSLLVPDIKELTSKKVKFALQKNMSFDYQTTVKTEFDSVLKPSRSVLKPSQTSTPVATTSSRKVTSRRKSSRFLRHS